jgi:hypothetical protein
MIQRLSIGNAPLRLHQDRLVPIETQPTQILKDPVDELGPAARRVEILDPDEKSAAVLLRP